MHIDWFVFAAQIINFLILVALLKFFLYDRIVKAMDARQASVASRLEEAERLKEEARKRLLDLEEQNRQIKERTLEILNQAQKEAEEHRSRLLASAENDALQSRRRWRETLAREREAFYESLRLKAGTFIFSTIRRILEDMAGQDLESRVVDVFVERIGAMDASQQEMLRRSLDSGPREIVVVSAFELSRDQKEKIIDAVRPYISEDVHVRCEVSPANLAGIELLTHGYRLAWNMEGHLAELEEAFRNALKEEIPELGIDGEDRGAASG